MQKSLPSHFTLLYSTSERQNDKQKGREIHRTKITLEGEYYIKRIYKKGVRLPPDERLFKVTNLTVASSHCFTASEDALGTSSDSSFSLSSGSSMSIFSPAR